MNENIKDIEDKTMSRNFIYSIMITIIIGLINIVYPLLVGLIYGPEILANFSVLFYWSTILNIPISSGLAPAISRFISITNTKNRIDVIQYGEKISLFYLIGVVSIYPFLGYFVFKLPFVEIIIILTLLLSLIYHYLFRKSLQGEEEFSKLFKLEIISLLVFLPLMIVFCILPNYLGWQNLINTYYFFIPIICYNFTFIILVIIQKKRRLYLSDYFKFPNNAKRILLYALFIGLGSLFSYGMSQIQIVVSELYLGEFEIGVLSFWTSAVAAINILTVGFRSVLFPRITNLQKIDISDKSNVTLNFTKSLDLILTLLFLPITCLFFVLIQFYPSLLDTLTFNKFSMTEYWLIVVLLSTREILLLILSPSITYILSSEKYVKLNPIISFINMIAIVLCWIFLTPKYGIFGFAAGLAIGSFVLIFIVTIILLFISKRKNGFHFILILVYSSLIIGTLFIFNIWNNIFLIIFWSIITVASIIFGVLKLSKILKNRDLIRSSNNEILAQNNNEKINID